MCLKKSTAKANGTYLKERDTNREFWKLQIDHKQEFDYGIIAKAKLDLLSDNNYDKEYFKKIHVTSRYNIINQVTERNGEYQARWSANDNKK